VHEIESEFDGLPADRVLLDSGDWIYLRQNVLMRDRQPILTSHRTPHYGLIDRIRGQEYAKILVHSFADGGYAYDLGEDRGIRREMMAHYQEVRRIRGVRGMDNWDYHGLMMSDISVLEPIQSASASTENTTGVANRGPR